jgi:hypothetical protein
MQAFCDVLFHDFKVSIECRRMDLLLLCANIYTRYKQIRVETRLAFEVVAR